MTEDRDIQQLREFRSELAEPSAERLARVRARVANQAAPRARWSVRGLAIPAIAAAAVLAVAVGAGVVAFDGDPGGAAPPVATSTEPAPPPREKTSSRPDPVDPDKHQAAVTLLEQLAAAAGTGPAPLTVPSGQLLYVRGTGFAGSGKPESYLHEMWMDVNGGFAVMIRRHDNGERTVLAPDPNNPKDNHGQEIAAQREQLNREGPSLNQPTPAYLAALPTDPDAMLALLRKAAVDAGGPWSEDHAILDYLRNFLYSNEPLITPQVRATIYRAVAKLPSITGTDDFFADGYKVFAIGQSERGQHQELLIDAETGRVVGGRNFSESTTEPVFYDLWTHAVVAKPGDTP